MGVFSSNGRRCWVQVAILCECILNSKFGRCNQFYRNIRLLLFLNNYKKIYTCIVNWCQKEFIHIYNTQYITTVICQVNDFHSHYTPQRLSEHTRVMRQHNSICRNMHACCIGNNIRYSIYAATRMHIIMLISVMCWRTTSNESNCPR